MSHVTETVARQGSPVYKDLHVLAAACRELGLELVLPEGARIETYETAEGPRSRIVGRDGRPCGMDMSMRSYYEGRPENRCVAVIRVAKPTGGTKPYEMGLIPDKVNAGCWLTKHDPFAGGMGLEAIVGTARHGEVMAPKLVQMYGLMSDKLIAEAQGYQFTVARKGDTYVSEIEVPDQAMPVYQY